MDLVDNMEQDNELFGDMDAEQNELEELQEEDLQEFYDESFKDLSNGQVIKGRVISVKENEVIVDIGAKCEGTIPLEEFMRNAEDQNVYVGREYDVFIVKREDKEGAPVLSRNKARDIKSRQHIRDAYESGDSVDCKIMKVVKGGLQVDCGITGFMPFSHTGVRRGQQEELESMVGETVKAKIIELRGRQDAILSHRLYIEEERAKIKKETMATLEEGQIVKGIVKNLTEFGAFIDLGGIDGLLHLNDMSWRHVTKPEDIVSIGEEIEVKVLSIDGERISLGIKQMTPDPWIGAEQKFPPGSVIEGKVTSLTKYGAFIELTPGVEGLIHISEMSWTHRVKHPSEMFKVGDTIKAQVLKVDEAEKRISLGYKQTKDNPWDSIEIRYPSGTIVEGTVVGLTDFGAFVRLEEGVDGMIHVSDMSWTKKVQHPSEVLKEGDEVQAAVMEVDGSSRRISLGLKQAEPDPWSRAKKTYRVGSHVEGLVVKLTDFGVFVELEEGIEGLIHISELSEDRINHPEEVVKPGEKLNVKVIKCDPRSRKIGLSIREFHQDVEKQEVRKYMGSGEESLGTMGDLLSHALKQYEEQEDDQVEQSPQEPEETIEEVEEAAEEVLEEVSSEEEPDEEETAEEQAEEPVEAPAEEQTEEQPEAEEETAAEESAEQQPEEQPEAEAETAAEAPAEEQTEEQPKDEAETAAEEPAEEQAETEEAEEPSEEVEDTEPESTESEEEDSSTEKKE